MVTVTKARITAYYILFAITFPILLILCLPIYLLRFMVAMARKVFRPDLGNLVTTRSAVIANDDPGGKHPNWNLCVWLTMEGNLNFETFKQTFHKDIVLKKIPNGEFESPEFQQYFYRWSGFLFWKWEDNFDINEHMKYYFALNENSDFKITTEDQLKQIIKSLTAKPFRNSKSPWEFLFIPNYLENGDCVPQKSVLIFRTHHGFCDGYTILRIILQEINKVNLDKVAKPTSIKESLLSKIMNCCLFWFRAPYGFVELLIESKDKNLWHSPELKLRKPFNTSFTPKIPLECIKDIKNTNNVAFTSIVMASLTGGLRNMILEVGGKVPNYITTAVAVPMPNHPNKLCNHFIFSFLKLPVGISDPSKRLSKVEKNFQKLKRSPVPAFSFELVPVFGGLFTWMIDLLSSNEFSTVLTSNFPGPQEPIRFVGGGGSNLITDVNFTAGMGVGNVGIGFCMVSYNHNMRIVTSVDKSILPTDIDVEKLNDKILEEFEILKQLHSV